MATLSNTTKDQKIAIFRRRCFLYSVYPNDGGEEVEVMEGASITTGAEGSSPGFGSIDMVYECYKLMVWPSRSRIIFEHEMEKSGGAIMAIKGIRHPAWNS